MAPQFQVNINIAAGVDFTQDFIVNNPDGSPVNLTGCTFSAAVAKHPTAVDARVSTSGAPVRAYVPFTARVVDGLTGRYSITMLAEQTSKLEEGKYVYNVVMRDTSGELSDIMSGLAFVDVAFAGLVPPPEIPAPTPAPTPTPVPTPTPTPSPTPSYPSYY